MTHQNNLTTSPFQSTLLGKRMLWGAGIALVLISFFLFSAGDLKPEWGKL